MTPTPQAITLFLRETLYEQTNIARTSIHRFIVRARNIATNEIQLFIVDCKQDTINKLI